MDPTLITRFFAAFAANPDRLRIPRGPDLPPDMLAEEKLAPPWVRWKLIPSRVAPATFKEWEDDHGVHLPESFRAFFLSHHTLQLDCSIVRLACSPSNKPFSDLDELLEWNEPPIRDRQIFPIGDESLGNAGPLCLDLRGKVEEPPVVYWDAEREEISAPIFSSFPRLLELTTFAMATELRLFEQESLLAQFLAMDPEGAGGPGLTYWQGDGVFD